MKSFSRLSFWLGMMAIATALALPARANTAPAASGQPSGRAEPVPRGRE